MVTWVLDWGLLGSESCCATWARPQVSPPHRNGGLLGEGNGIPVQYSCLENPVDGGAWCAPAHGVAKSRTRLSDFTFMRWRRKWQPTPVFLPGESRGQRSLVSCHLWGLAESDTTEATQQPQQEIWGRQQSLAGGSAPWTDCWP